MILNRPKLVFFQCRYDDSLPEFLLIHKQEHVRCLAEFFEVSVVSEDCDYSEVCDTHQPDLCLFETGLNLLTCRRPKVANSRANSRIPKLGLANADAWCETRAGMLSELEHLGIETLFSISITAAEHTPEMASRLFVWPNFVDPEVYRDFGEHKVIPVLLTGAVAPQYPWRQRVFMLVSSNFPTLIWRHPGYAPKANGIQVLHGERYARTLNASLLVPACGTIANEFVRKHLEIPASNACLVTERTPALEAAGFLDMNNCVFVDEHNVVEKITYLLSRPDELKAITERGHRLVHSRHALKCRSQIFEWFQLQRGLTADQKIIQTTPFGPLTVVPGASGVHSSHLRGDGLHLKLLREGDQMLKAACYDQAETLYLECSSYMRALPEPKLKLAICHLYGGQAERARAKLFDLIEYTVAEYNAPDPDPVEWAYYIISLLCEGDLSNAFQRVNQYPTLSHPELDFVRRVAEFIWPNVHVAADQAQGRTRRPSIHQLAERTFEGWMRELCKMLIHCGQLNLAQKIEGHASAVNPRRPDLTEASNGELGLKAKSIGTKVDVTVASARAAATFKREILYYKIRRKLKRTASNALRKFQKSLRLEYSPFSAREQQRSFQSAIASLIRETDIRTVAVVGAAIGGGCIQAFLRGILAPQNGPRVFCISCSDAPLPRHRHLFAEAACVKWYGLWQYSLADLGEGVARTLQKIREENHIPAFDAVVMDESVGELDRKGALAAHEEILSARFILIDRPGRQRIRRTYENLLNNPAYDLLYSNIRSRSGCAIFAKARAGNSGARFRDQPRVQGLSVLHAD